MPRLWADAGRRESGTLIEQEGVVQLILNSLRYPNCVGRVCHAAQEDSELVAAKACERIDRPQGPFESFGKSNEQEVAMYVAEAVVYVLEAIEIQKQDGKQMIRCAF
jgi:hypothetical protein